jgi:hypothetical protein
MNLPFDGEDSSVPFLPLFLTDALEGLPEERALDFSTPTVAVALNMSGLAQQQ